jgi:hypothetical protein
MIAMPASFTLERSLDGPAPADRKAALAGK